MYMPILICHFNYLRHTHTHTHTHTHSLILLSLSFAYTDKSAVIKWKDRQTDRCWFYVPFNVSRGCFDSAFQVKPLPPSSFLKSLIFG